MKVYITPTDYISISIEYVIKIGMQISIQIYYLHASTQYINVYCARLKVFIHLDMNNHI